MRSPQPCFAELHQSLRAVINKLRAERGFARKQSDERGMEALLFKTDQKEGVQCESESELGPIERVMTGRKSERMDLPESTVRHTKQNVCKEVRSTQEPKTKTIKEVEESDSVRVCERQ